MRENFRGFHSTAKLPCRSAIDSISLQNCYSKFLPRAAIFHSKRESFPPRIFKKLFDLASSLWCANLFLPCSCILQLLFLFLVQFPAIKLYKGGDGGEFPPTHH